MKVTKTLRPLLFISLCSFLGQLQANNINEPSRYSFAISGGASKGAYEAGLNWSLIKMMLSHKDLRHLLGGELHPFEMSSITGASAGGINTLLSGLTWCSKAEHEGGLDNRINDNVFRDIWLRIDIKTLLPPHADSPIYLPDDAVLSRRDMLLSSAELIKKWNTPIFRKDCRVPLGVTVTSITPEILSVDDVEVQNQRFYIPFELKVTEEGTVKFSFDPAAYPKVADPAMILMPRPVHKPALSIDDKRVEDTAFTTSAFPMAFGRKRLEYCKLTIHNIKDTNKELSSKSHNQSSLVCPDSYELAEAEFADGGLFDNLPIGLARLLAEENVKARDKIQPVTYLYLDPNRIRYEIPEVEEELACDSDSPPDACRTMEFSASSESQLLLGFLGTARRYELYRELTSDDWQLSLSEISYKLAEILRHENTQLDCKKELPYFDLPLDCAESLLRAGQLVEIAYDLTRAVINQPYSIDKLSKAKVIDDCKQTTDSTTSITKTTCDFDIVQYRKLLADAMLSISRKAKLDDRKIYTDIKESILSIHNDRSLRVTSRGAPITGTLLEDFGSFLDYKFREYDYYVGVYDGVIMVAHNMCSLQYSPRYQSQEYRQCHDIVGKGLYSSLGINTDPKAKYVFARLAHREFSKEALLDFAYNPMPDVDEDMHIIHEGLEKSLAAGENEKVFFTHLKDTGFKPTSEDDAGGRKLPKLIRPEEKTLMEQIIDDPDAWATELTRRVTTRLVYLESEAKQIYDAREPDKEKRETANTELMGATAFVLQSGTYRYPASTFSPSTAPGNWFWRNVIPYEVGFDLSEGDLTLTWQPTWSLSKKDLAVIRGSLGFPGGLLGSSADTVREKYFALGLGYTRRTSSVMISSYGITPTWYHAFKDPVVIDQDTIGGDIHVSFFKDRLRVGLGTRDIDNIKDTWFLTVGITDIPGAVYWLTR